MCFAKNERMSVVDLTVDGRCSNCGECCSNFLPINYQEVVRIKKYIKEKNIQECVRQVSVGWGRKVNDPCACPFRDDKNKCCTIYPVRPAICRDFQCNKPKEELLKNRKEAHMRSDGAETDMRATFFGGESVLELMLNMLEAW